MRQYQPYYVVVMDSKKLKWREHWLPLHNRYWVKYGYARRIDRDTAEVQIWGPALDGFDKLVAIRRNA